MPRHHEGDLLVIRPGRSKRTAHKAKTTTRRSGFDCGPPRAVGLDRRPAYEKKGVLLRVQIVCTRAGGGDGQPDPELALTVLRDLAIAGRHDMPSRPPSHRAPRLKIKLVCRCGRRVCTVDTAFDDQSRCAPPSAFPLAPHDSKDMYPSRPTGAAGPLQRELSWEGFVTSLEILLPTPIIDS